MARSATGCQCDLGFLLLGDNFRNCAWLGLCERWSFECQLDATVTFLPRDLTICQTGRRLDRGTLTTYRWNLFLKSYLAMSRLLREEEIPYARIFNEERSSVLAVKRLYELLRRITVTAQWSSAQLDIVQAGVQLCV
jgi:hypothetical protein